MRNGKKFMIRKNTLIIYELFLRPTNISKTVDVTSLEF